MQFLYPGMLMLLGLIPVLILIHLLKPKPTQVDVTNLFLWQEVLKERGRRIRLEHLKKNLPLLFQILIVIVVALALAIAAATQAPRSRLESSRRISRMARSCILSRAIRTTSSQ